MEDKNNQLLGPFFVDKGRGDVWLKVGEELRPFNKKGSIALAKIMNENASRQKDATTIPRSEKKDQPQKVSKILVEG